MGLDMGILNRFKTPTRAPAFYDSNDVQALRRRVRELEEVVDKYRTKRVGPYKVTIEIQAPNWPGVIEQLRQLAAHAELAGPEGLDPSFVADSGGYSWRTTVESNTQGGAGETDADTEPPPPPPPYPPQPEVPYKRG